MPGGGALSVLGVLVLVLALVACGGNDAPDDDAAGNDAVDLPGEPWQGPPQAEEDGTVSVVEFNALIEQREPDWAQTPLLAAAAFYGERDRAPGEGGEVTIVAERAEDEDERTVVVTEDGLPDDSIRAVRYTLRFERAADNSWRLAEAQWAQRCQPDRGHQDFEPELCV